MPGSALRPFHERGCEWGDARKLSKKGRSTGSGMPGTAAGRWQRLANELSKAKGGAPARVEQAPFPRAA